MIKTFCDVCKNELTRNMVDKRLLVNHMSFEAEVLISKNGTNNEGDLCYDCLLKMLNKPAASRKPRKDIGTHREKKPEQVSLLTRKKKAKKVAIKDTTLVDISTFSVVTGQGDEPYLMRLSGVEDSFKTIIGGAAILLSRLGIDLEYVRAAPESEGKRELLSILVTGSKEG